MPDDISTTDGLIAHIEELVKQDAHIRLSLIEVAKHIAPERVPVYMSAREKRIRRLQEESEKRRAEKQETYRKYIEETNVAAAALEQACFSAFKEDGDIRNQTITTAQADKDGYPIKSSTSILLYLLRKYGIHVPLKTQGWINNSLHSVKICDGSVSRVVYNKKSVVSNKAVECINALSEAIRNTA